MAKKKELAEAMSIRAAALMILEEKQLKEDMLHRFDIAALLRTAVDDEM